MEVQNSEGTGVRICRNVLFLVQVSMSWQSPPTIWHSIKLLESRIRVSKWYNWSTSQYGTTHDTRSSSGNCHAHPSVLLESKGRGSGCAPWARSPCILPPPCAYHTSGVYCAFVRTTHRACTAPCIRWMFATLVVMIHTMFYEPSVLVWCGAHAPQEGPLDRHQVCSVVALCCSRGTRGRRWHDI